MEKNEQVLHNQLQPNVKKHFFKNKSWISILVISFLSACIATYLFVSLDSKTKNLMLSKPSNTPTPMPFQELTIPYLRERSYKSTLGNLEKTYETESYTAYLTNYDSDGFKVNGLLTIPNGEKPKGGWPAVVFIHGYIPPKQYETTEQYYDYVDFLARNGFVVFKIDLRGHGNSEGDAGGGYFGSDYIIDTLNAYAALESSDFVDLKKIGLWGHSMAGNVVLRSFAAKPTIPAVVIWAGAVYTYVDRVKYGINDASYQPLQASPTGQSKRRLLFETYGDPSNESPFWKQVIPTNFLGDLKGAIQIDHAVDDSVVNIGYSRDLNDLLNKISVSHRLNEYPSGGHNISGASFSTAMQNTVNFYKAHFK